MQKMWGGSKYEDTGLAFYVKVVKLYCDWSKSTFPSKPDKKYSFAVLWRFFVPCIKLGSYFCYQECSVHVRRYAFAYSWNLEKYIDFSNFLRAFLLLIRDKYLVFYCCFSVRISLIGMWSHRPWLRLLTKPTPILSLSICSFHNFVVLSCVDMNSWA